jgi:hypothetical protein
MPKLPSPLVLRRVFSRRTSAFRITSSSPDRHDRVVSSPNLPLLAILGAFDRFNYGDLLFPLILTPLVEKAAEGRFRVAHVGLRRSHLHSAGAIPTHSLRWLLQPGRLAQGSAILVAGGELLAADWDSLMSHHLPSRIGDGLFAAMKRVFGAAAVRSLAKARFGAPWEIPFVIDPGAFPIPVRILYNAVGGSELHRQPAAWVGTVTKLLGHAHYCSVRDERTRKTLAEHGAAPDLAPDCAVLLSDAFPLPALDARAGASVAAVRRLFPEGYLCFQYNRYIGQVQMRRVARQLEAASRSTGLPVLLLPLGEIAGHSDRIALNQLRRMLSVRAAVAERTTIFGQAALIAHSRFFLGTSLHGVITALSYGVPFAALEKVPKAAAFVRTWCLPPFDSAISTQEIADAISARLTQCEETLHRQAQSLKSAARSGIDRLLAALVD